MTQDDTSGLQFADACESLNHLSRLSAWIAHEVNNSIGGIHTSFALLQRLIPVDHPQYRFVAAIEREIARSSALTTRLQQSWDFDPERYYPIPLSTALIEGSRSLVALCQARNVRLAIANAAGDGAEPKCSALMRVAIRHLLQHAVEHAADGQVVEVQATFGPAEMSVTVSGGDVQAALGKGLAAGPDGLALAIVRQVARTLDGAVIIDESTGQENRVRLTLPAHAHAEEQECPSKE